MKELLFLFFFSLYNEDLDFLLLFEKVQLWYSDSDF